MNLFLSFKSVLKVSEPISELADGRAFSKASNKVNFQASKVNFNVF